MNKNILLLKIIFLFIIFAFTNFLKASEPFVGSNNEPIPLKGNRFVTLCIMIRTTPWEVSRDVKLHPRDEGDWHTLDGVRSLREAFAKNNPDGRLTWGFTMNALEDQRENYKQIRQYIVECICLVRGETVKCLKQSN